MAGARRLNGKDWAMWALQLRMAGIKAKAHAFCEGASRARCRAATKGLASECLVFVSWDTRWNEVEQKSDTARLACIDTSNGLWSPAFAGARSRQQVALMRRVPPARAPSRR